MKKLMWLLVSLCVSILGIAQSDHYSPGSQKGIAWIAGLTWEQVKTKAKAEGKYIFVDCFATWCIPCKEMDQQTYVDEKVGQFINKKFISIKVQMDRTENDDEYVKEWYAEVLRLAINYSISAFPSFLFFDSHGNPVHKATGYKDPESFLNVASDALNPRKQFYAILKNFQPGKMDTSEMKGLAFAFAGNGTDISEKIAVDYLSRIPREQLGMPANLELMVSFQKNAQILEIIAEYLNGLNKKKITNVKNLAFLNRLRSQPKVQEIVISHLKYLNRKKLSLKENLELLSYFKGNTTAQNIAVKYLNGLTKKSLYTKEMIPFIADFVQTPNDRYFYWFFGNRGKVDSIMGKAGYAESIINKAIVAEEINPPIIAAYEQNRIPDFDQIHETVKNKYGIIYADYNVLRAKATVYGYLAGKNNSYWEEYLKYNTELLNRYGTDTTSVFEDMVTINNFVFNGIFYHSSDPSQICSGLKWMEGVLRRNPTDANFMDTYASLLYKAGRSDEAINWQKKALKIAKEDKKQEARIPSIESNLKKMQNGIPTWKR